MNNIKYAEYNKTASAVQVGDYYYCKIKNNEWSGITYNALFMPYDWAFDKTKYGISDSVL